MKKLKRAEGHFTSVIAMFADGRECLDIVQQLHAVELAVKKAKGALVHDYIGYGLDLAVRDRASLTGVVIGDLKGITKYLY